MIWRLIARTFAALHIAYATFVVLGSLLVLFWTPLIWLHLIAVTWAGATLVFDFGCPLTPWEKRFWKLGGVEPYPEGFLQHYILRPFTDLAHERRNHIMAGAAIVALNAVIYLLIFARR